MAETYSCFLHGDHPQEECPKCVVSSKNDLTERALDSLDELARDWAAQIGLSIMVANVRSSQDGVYALALQAFIEGAYRGRTSPRSAPETHCTHCGGTGFDGDEPCEFCAASGRADETKANPETIVTVSGFHGYPPPVYTVKTPVCPKCGQIDVRIPRMGIYHVCPPGPAESSPQPDSITLTATET